ncbi:MAG: hypothetical protein WDO71_04740 [Bacteroidota bacterium]
MIIYSIFITSKADKDEQLIYEYITKTFGEIYATCRSFFCSLRKIKLSGCYSLSQPLYGINIATNHQLQISYILYKYLSIVGQPQSPFAAIIFRVFVSALTAFNRYYQRIKRTGSRWKSFYYYSIINI